MEFLWKIAPVIHFGLAAAFSAVVISRRRSPEVTLAWILCFLFLPYAGILLYLLFGYTRLRRKRLRKPSTARRATVPNERGGAPRWMALEPDLARIEALAANLTEMPVVSGNRVVVYEDAASSYEAMADSIRNASHHAHLEFYIFQPDRTGIYFRDLLIEKAREGVRCKLLMDSVGSWRVTRRFVRPMEAAGVQVAFFWPVKVFRRPWAFHLRNHRKLMVVDGKIGFIGSQNIRDEHARHPKRKVSWRDTHLKVEGPALTQFQMVFAEDWAFTTNEELHGAEYFPDQVPMGPTRVQMLPTGPDKEESFLRLIFLEAVHAARERITVRSPYFVPDSAILLALEGAARRGVRVDILLPTNSDHPIVLWAGRSWYRELLESGVHIFEHGEDFLHAKVVTVDRKVALVGSANMDIRSFRINFEASVLLYDTDVTSQLQKSFDTTIASAEEIRLADLAGQPFGRSFLVGVCRLLSPIL